MRERRCDAQQNKIVQFRLWFVVNSWSFFFFFNFLKIVSSAPWAWYSSHTGYRRKHHEEQNENNKYVNTSEYTCCLV